MDISSSNKIQGIIPETPGILYGQYDRLNELNDRIKGRQFSDRPLQPNYDPRPVPTKYSLFPIIERRKSPPETPLANYLDYSSESNFAPISGKGTVDGFLRNVNTESSLRNQYFGLQKSDQSVYVPASSSDLYGFSAVGRQETQTHPSLFQQHIFDNRQNANINPAIGSNKFFNHTRTQLRGL
jgi:hypothetical protein